MNTMYLAVGRLAITSNPRARDNLVDTLLILCQLDAGEDGYPRYRF